MGGLFDGTPLERAVTCEVCGVSLGACACPRDADGSLRLARDQSPRVRREKRRGKWATVVAGLHADDAKTLLKDLKVKLGTGGGVTEGELIFQGDHREKVVAMLLEMGYRAKAAGG